MDLDLDGHFWLPEQPTARVRGHLRWSAVDGGDLALERFLTPGGSVTGLVPVIEGRRLDGMPVTLVDSFVRRFQSSGPVMQRWHVNDAYLGTATADPSTSTLAVDVDGLSAFTGGSGLAIEGGYQSRTPVKITWSPRDHPISLSEGVRTLELVDDRNLDLAQDHVSVEDHHYLRITLDDRRPWGEVAMELATGHTLLEFLADRPMGVRRQWEPSDGDGDIDHLFQPVAGMPPDDPDKVWLTFDHVQSNISQAFRQWSHLFHNQRDLIGLVAEEVRFRRATNSVERILRLTRILELLHRHRHPDAAPEDDAEVTKIQSVLQAAPVGLEGWLTDRLGVTQVRLRQRIRETIAEFDGLLDHTVVDVDIFARVATKTRNWHTHYGDSTGIATGVCLA